MIEKIELPDHKFTKSENSISRIVGVEQNIGVSKLKNGKVAFSMREGEKQLIFELDSNACNNLIEILKYNGAIEFRERRLTPREEKEYEELADILKATAIDE